MPRTLLALIAVLATLSASASAQKPAVGDWPLHNLDPESSRFSPLDQINATNAGKLAVKWQLDLPRTSSVGTATPIVVGGIMYVNSGQTLFAIDASTGTTMWTKTAAQEFPGGGRGPAYGDGRVYAAGRSMIAAFEAETGRPVAAFGTNGVLNPARVALDFKDPGKYPADVNPETLGYFMASAPTYANGTLFVGLASSEGLVPGGLVVALDGPTGRVKWVFRTIPQGPKDDGWDLIKDTWSGTDRLGGGVWSAPAVDAALGMVYVNVSNPSPNYDGSKRKGANLFTNSIVALDMNTGKLKWHVQALHHDIWDWDLVTGPTLFEVTVKGKVVKGLASLAKTCYVYAVNRETGKPIFPIIETAVPTKSDVPGEEVYPTQPIPYTARFVPQSPFCATFPPNIEDPKLAEKSRVIFTPPSSKEALLIAPGAVGGPNRGSSAFSPRTGWLYVTGKNNAMILQAKPLTAPLQPGLNNPGHFQNIIEWKMSTDNATQNIAAYDPATGDLAWVTEFPGTTNGGNLVTAGDVVFQAIGRNFYAVDARTGKKLAEVAMKISTFSTPMAYLAGGKQLVAIASGSSIVALGLP
ncbi:MAG TPA: PQQ-binding-like beta-propeller repeat protein [Vicinamibacterales bacterium]|jgi:quinoprotein glucose dehydrogenase|nr:PQQ-binding-like beta-propeller repeat protein [Vicinamibacterales bacterium]